MIFVYPIKKSFTGTFEVPADKSISHRAAILGSIACGTSVFHNFLPSKDCLATINCLKKLGVSISLDDNRALTVAGKGLEGLKEPDDILDAENSGTTIRLLSGLLTSAPFFSIITGDASLRRRPMARITSPLRQMGGNITGRADNRFPPLSIKGGKLSGIQYLLPVPSAQVKSCILLAGLHASGVTQITETIPSRDHTERMLAGMGADISTEENIITLKPDNKLQPITTAIPGDISSAAFLAAAALLIPGSHITIKNVGLNPSRMGFIKALIKMGASLEVEQQVTNAINEPFGSLHIQESPLKGITIDEEDIPLLVDEIPILAILAAKAQGETVIKGASELRLKESDRLALAANNLRKMGVEVVETSDGLIIQGNQSFKGGEIETAGDHRIVMAFAIAGLTAKGKTIIHDHESSEVSYPGFWNLPLFE